MMSSPPSRSLRTTAVQCTSLCRSLCKATLEAVTWYDISYRICDGLETLLLDLISAACTPQRATDAPATTSTTYYTVTLTAAYLVALCVEADVVLKRFAICPLLPTSLFNARFLLRSLLVELSSS